MEYRCGYCNKVLKNTDDIFIKEIGEDHFIPYCSKQHKNNDDIENKIFIVRNQVLPCSWQEAVRYKK